MSDAHIYDRSYRAYDGERRGLGNAMLTLGVHAGQRTLGIKRSVWSKLIPTAIIAISLLPAVVFVGLAAFLPEDLLEEDILPQYQEYYGFIVTSIVLFTAFVAPEVVCTDRRTGMLGLYFASPLNRDTYLIAKTGAVVALLGLVTLVPPLLLLIAYTIEGAGPDGVIEFIKLLAQIVASGFVLATMLGVLSIAVSSFTSRRAGASVALVLIMLVFSGFVNGIVESDSGPDALALLNVLDLPFELVQRIYGEDKSFFGNGAQVLDTGVLILGWLAWLVAMAFIARFNYQRLRVRR